MKRFVISLLVLAFLFSACTAPGLTPSTPATSLLLPIATSSAVDSPVTAPTLTATYVQKSVEAFITVPESVFVRSGPSTDFDVIRLLSAGQQYAVVGQSGDWWQIQFSEQVGWVYKGVTSFTGDAQAIPDTAAISNPNLTLVATPANFKDAVANIQALMNSSDLNLVFVEMTTMINSPNMDLAVALYQDTEGRKYSVEPRINQVVEIDARAALSSIPSDTLLLSQDELRARAEALVRVAIPDFESRQAVLSYEEGVKGDYFFFTWRATGSTGFMNKPFVQIGLHKSGELFAYYNTLGQIGLP